MFYVYEWYNINSCFVFYVGKGCGNRYKSTQKRNKLFKNYLKNNKCDVRIIAKFDLEEMAFEYERKRIVELKNIGQANCNLDDGGKGGPKFIWTDEMREYKSVYNPMKDEKQRKRMSKHNPMKNPKVVAKVRASKCKSVIVGTKEFPSIVEAALYFNVLQATIIKWCKKGINPNHELCRYKNSEQVEFKGKRYNHGGCREVIYNGKIYETPADVAKELGLHHSTVTKWAKRGYAPNGIECRYTDDKSVHVFKPYVKGEKIRKPIYVNGILYESKAEAERALGLCKGYLAPYIAGTRKNDKYICKYVNQ